MLPSGDKLMLSATVTDSFEGSTRHAFGPVNMSAPAANDLRSLLQQTVANASSSAGLDAAALARALLVVSEVAVSGNRSATSQVLTVLEAVTPEASLRLDTAQGVVDTLDSLSNRLSSTEARRVLTLAGQVANHTVGITEELGGALLLLEERATAALLDVNGRSWTLPGI